MKINLKALGLKTLLGISLLGSVFVSSPLISEEKKEEATAPAAIIKKMAKKDAEIKKFKDEERTDRGNWGVANLEKVRNMTTSYTDMFFEEDQSDLGSRLPNNTIIQISTLKNDIQEGSGGDEPEPKSADEIFKGVETTLAWRQLEDDSKKNIKTLIDWIGSSELSKVKSPGALRDKVETFVRKKDFEKKFKGNFSGKLEDFGKVLNAQTVSLFKSLAPKKNEAESPYRFYAARKLLGSWRLVADTSDPTDPATKFIVEHYRDNALNDWLGIRAQAQDNFYMSAEGNNAITLSAEKFAQNDARDAHWKLDGSNLNDCALINRKIGGFLSCRDLSDEKKLKKFGFDPRTGGALDYTDYEVVGRRVKTYSPGFHLYEKHPEGRNFQISRDTQLEPGLMARVKKMSEFFYHLKGFHVKRYLETAAAKDDTSKKDEKRDFLIRDPEKNPYKLHELMLVIAKCYRYAKDTQDPGQKSMAEVSAKAISAEAKQALQRYYAQGKSEKRELSYGDKIKLVSTKTWRHLYGKKGRHTAFKATGNFNQGVPVCSTDYDDGDEALGLKEEESWWIIKGPHKKGDSFNAKMGEPVKNGDIIRLENVKNKKNLHCTKADMVSLGTKFRKNTMVTIYGQDGDGDSFDNWVINFADTKEPNLHVGQPFELKSQNTGSRLATDFDKKYFLKGSAGGKVEFASAIEKTKDETEWAIDSYIKGSLPVENVGWTGVPYGAPSSDKGPKEALKVDIVKLGMGGGIAPNNTLEIKVNVQDKRPMVSGFAKEEIPDFAPGFLVNLSPLFSRGVAWVTQSFENEGKASASFLVRGGDAGNAEIMLGNNMTLDYTYKFILGASENTETQLIRRDIDSGGRPHDTVVAKITKEENPLAALRSGAFAPYWISVHEGTIILGVGDDIGDNVLLMWRDPNPRTQVSRLGFGSDRDATDYTNVQIGDALSIAPPDLKYAVARDEVKLGSGQIMVHDIEEFEKQEVDGDPKFPDGVKFRVPGRGSLSFNIKGSDEFSVALSSKGADKDSSGQVRYVLKLYGDNVSDDFERRAGVMVEYLSQIVQLFDEKLAASDDAQGAVRLVRKALDSTFSKLPKQSVDQIKNAVKDLFRDFDEWNKFKKGFERVKEELEALGMFVPSGQKANIKKLQSSSGISEEDLKTGDPVKKLAKALFHILRGNTGVKPCEKRDEIGSTGPKSAKEAVVVMLEQIFANPHFDIEGRPVCVLEKFNKDTGKLEAVGSVLETDISSHSSFAKIPRDSYRKYWVNFSQGRIFVGSDDFGKNLFFYNWDKGPQDDFVQIGLTSKGDATIRDFTVSPELAITRAQKMAAYKQDKQLFDFKGKLQVISPYKYRLSQEGPSVKFKDELTGKTYYPGKVPQKGASYFFMLVLREDGFPQLVWSREPENPQKLNLEKSAYIKKAESDTLFQASTYVQGMGVIGGMIGVGASVSYSGLGVDAGKEAAEMEATAMLDYKGHDSYVYTDQAKLDKLVSSSIPQAAQANQGNFQRELGIGGNWIGDPGKMGLLIPHFRKVISRVTHPFVVSNQSDKNLLFSHLSSLFNTHKKTYANPQMPVDNTYSDLIKLLMAAYNNRYLVNENNNRERKIRNDWYAKANDLARQILKKDPEHTVKLEPMYGEYIWLNDTFKDLGQGSVTFEATGQNDAMVCFASEPIQVRNTTNQIYEVSIGSWENEKTVIRTKSLGKTVAEVTHPEMRCKIVKAESDPKATKYWISVDNGKITMGKGDLDPKNAIGTVDIDTGEISKVIWEEPEFGATDKVKELARIESKLNGMFDIQKLLVTLATALSKSPFDTQGYLILLEKSKPTLSDPGLAESMALATAPPAKPEEYQGHLGQILSKVDQELKAIFSTRYKPLIGDLKKAINLKKHKDFKKLLSSLPEDSEKYGEHLSKVVDMLQKTLPSFLDENPAYHYTKEGRYSAEPFHWQDPYPIRNLKYVGISSWDAPVEFSKITVGPRAQEVALFKSNLIAKIRAMRGEKLNKIIDLTKTTPMGKKKEAKKEIEKVKKDKDKDKDKK